MYYYLLIISLSPNKTNICAPYDIIILLLLFDYFVSYYNERYDFCIIRFN